MKIRLLSDLHQEFFVDESMYETKGEDVLVIAGDLAVGNMQVTTALDKFYETQKNIVYVPGNHEYYGTDIRSFDANLSVYARNRGINFLNPGYCFIDGVIYIGASLWTNFREDGLAKYACRTRVNDFKQITGATPDIVASYYVEHIKYIRSIYSLYPDKKKAIVTHFLPAVECIDPVYRGPDLINYYFANDLGAEIADMQNTTWLFGHTHSLVDITLGETRLVANPYGYGQNVDYVEKIIEV